MKKNDFVLLVLAVLGTLVFGVGMCMCLLPEWNAFRPGVVVCAAGILLLIVLAVLAVRRSGKGLPKPDWKLIGKGLYGVAAALVLGVGMCMILVWDMMLYGILVGGAGILLLLGLIPLIKGLN